MGFLGISSFEVKDCSHLVLYFHYCQDLTALMMPLAQISQDWHTDVSPHLILIYCILPNCPLMFFLRFGGGGK